MAPGAGSRCRALSRLSAVSTCSGGRGRRSGRSLVRHSPPPRRPEYEPTSGNVTEGFDYLNKYHLAIADEAKMVMTRGHALEW